jgi:hypothetical protein
MARGSGEDGKRRWARFYGWWYICIGLGFALLGLRNWIAHAPPWSVGLRFVIAAGFILLGFATFHSGGRSARESDRRRGEDHQAHWTD